jgi:hypothetical protein
MSFIEELNRKFHTVMEKVDRVSDKEAEMDFEDLDDKDLDNDGDVDKSDSYLHHRLSVVAKKDDKVEELKSIKVNTFNMDDLFGEAEEELEEISTTANVPAPPHKYAFGDVDDDVIKQGGKEKVKKTNKHYKKMDESLYKRMMSEMFVNEVSYREFKKDPTISPQQKVNKGIREINNMLAEMERVVNNNLKLKTEMGVDSSHFWKSSSKRMGQIYERMTRIGNKIRELSK